VFGKSVLKVV